MRTRTGRFEKQYTKKDITSYLQGIKKNLGRAPVYRDVKLFPGPSSTTIIRQFGSWSRALKIVGIRPHTHQLFRKEKGIIRKMWHRMTDKRIAKKLGIPIHVVRYHRLSSKLWKNSRKGNTRASQKQKAMKLYGKNCEICNIPIVEINHIISRKNDPSNWTILCPLCHAVLTRKLVTIQNRTELITKLLPYMQKIHKSFGFRK